MSLRSTKNNIFLIEVFKWIFDDRLILIEMFIRTRAFVGEIVILFVSMLSLSSKIYVHLTYILSCIFVHLSYFLQYIFCSPNILFLTYCVISVELPSLRISHQLWISCKRILVNEFELVKFPSGQLSHPLSTQRIESPYPSLPIYKQHLHCF